MPGSVRRRVLLGSACLLLFACRAEPPREAALGDEIGVGPYALEIVRARNAPNRPPPLSTFRNQPGKKGIVVFVRWRRLDGLDDIRRRVFIEKFLESQLSITTSTGERAEPTGTMYEKILYMQEPGANWQDWVVVFHVPHQSQDFKLLVENPEPGVGQSRLTSIPLKM